MSKEIKELEKILDTADNLYYTFGLSDLTDADYDAYKDQLRKLDPKNIRFKKVGSKENKASKWNKVKHDPFCMGSLNKVTSEEDFGKWFIKTTKADELVENFVIQEKLDGISIKLIYENGSLIHAITRGDGLEGEDILSNVKKMEGIQLTIPIKDKVLIRGEILLFKSKFNLLGGKNNRNTAAGTSKRLDGEGCEHLNIKVYDVMNWKELKFKKYAQVHEILTKWNFDVVNTKFVLTQSSVNDEMTTYISSKRKQLDWDIDGLVIKSNLLMNDDWKYPEFSIAYKFPSQKAITTLLDVEWNDTGGRICPVGILEPIDVGGITISKATLNNIEHIKSLGIKIGDDVMISRRNDVIPCIESVAVSKGKKDIVPPTHDKDGYSIVREVNAAGEELVYLISTNPNSKSKRMREILCWFTVHDVKGIAEATIESIIDANIATDLPSFYDICLYGDDRLLNIDGFGTSKFKLLNKAALQTKKTTLVKFLTGMDLSGFGEKRFISILEHFNKKTTLKDFLLLIENINNISEIPGFGNNTALTLKESINKKMKLIKEMMTKIEILSWEPGKIIQNESINGKSFCFTGSMSHDRSDLEKMVKENGGIVAGVSKNLDYLVTDNPNSGSGKNEKATILGIKKITEKEFLELINK